MPGSPPDVAPASSWRQRLGAGPRVPGALWLHAASVGEVRAAAPLVERLSAAGERLLLSTMTVTGREQCAVLHPGLPNRLAPLDLRPCVELALRRSPPRALVLIEGELWPSWIAACARRSLPVLLVSARMSDRSWRRHRALGGRIGRTLRKLAAIGARSEADAERLIALGADEERVCVTGDLKLDAGVPATSPGGELLRWLGEAPLVIGGSTHPGEEEALIEARRVWLEAGLDAALLLAPRRLHRVDELAVGLRRQGLTVRRRSEAGSGPLRAGEIGILDTLGELAGAYGRARIAFVGGTLAAVGGHNLIEPLLAGTPVCFGPHTDKQRPAAAWLEESGAGVRVADAATLAREVCSALRDPAAAEERARAGAAALEPHRGSSARSAELIWKEIR